MKIKIASLLLFFSVFLAGCITVSNFDRGHFIPSKNEPVEIEFETISDLIIIKAKSMVYQVIFYLIMGIL